MNVKEVDLIQISQKISELRDNGICLECCKWYTTPKTATCGHSLCQGCWMGRRACPTCAKPVDRRHLRHNEPLDMQTKHITEITAILEKTFKIKLDEFLMSPSDSLVDPNINVKEWLESSQNHFRAPPQSSDQSSPTSPSIANPIEVSSNQVQIHTNSRRTTKSPENVLHVPIPQDDWDKIEVMPDSTELDKNKENVIGPTDIETYNFMDVEYTVNNPRRSSRKRDHIETGLCKQKETSVDKQSLKDNTYDNDKKSNTARQNWNNVKKMKKEFSKLNKVNRNKLNVSIELAKKTQKIAQKDMNLNKAPSFVYDIDENTPDINQKNTKDLNEHHNVLEDINREIILDNCKKNSDAKNEKITDILIHKTNKNESTQHFVDPTNHQQKIAVNVEPEVNSQHGNTIKHSEIQTSEDFKVPFYKKAPLHKNNMEQGCSNETTSVKKSTHHFNSNTAANDDINITIKVGNSVISNITIKKNNDVAVKNMRECEAQTSLCLREQDVNKSRESVHELDAQRIVINVNNEQSITVNQNVPQTEQGASNLIASSNHQSEKTKKNTDSAETATAQFEITESVEKELSKVMEDIEIDEKNNSVSNDDQNAHKSHDVPLKSASHQNDLDYLNDIDLFDSESMKVQTLKSTKTAPSEILVCTARTKKRTQKQSEKRERDLCDENRLPISKKPKLCNYNATIVEEAIDQNKSTHNAINSEPLNYESILGKVFANIDADIEDKNQSQDIAKDTASLRNNNVAIDHENLEKQTPVITIQEAETSQHVIMSEVNEIDCSVVLNEGADKKDSENVFSSCGDQNVDNEQLIINSKVAPIKSQTNVDEFLTPVGHNLDKEGNMVMEADIVSDDSDKSVVEETPQKVSSFTKVKSKSNAKGTEACSSQKLQSERKTVSVNKTNLSNMPTVIDLTELSKRSSNDVTAIVVETARPIETPHNINKFVDEVPYRSTPLTRKSLNFNATGDIDQTLCSTNEVAKTTQEKEFLRKAFETTVSEKTVSVRNNNRLDKFCIAGTCLTSAELNKVKLLCARNKWTYTDKYSPELTHLVVAVDNENRAQRSVKFMCALASSKWIISFEWVQECLRTNTVVKEEPYEVLDNSGEPGPRRSRTAPKSLFDGMSFYCMEPFSILSADLLRELLEAAGGRVVSHCADIAVSEHTTRPALLLAEPEHTQEDKYTYLAMEQSVVPVNYEWVLNSIGEYSVASLRDQLLCPAALLHKATEKWPAQLMAHDEHTQ